MGKIVTFGEIMLRLTPPDHLLITETKNFEVAYGGSEANVAVALSCLGNKVEYVSAIPDNNIGHAIIKHLKSYGVDTSHIIMRGEVLGSYFLENGFGFRNTSVIYNRKSAEITKLTKESFSDADFDAIFEDCSIFHISGISFALSPSLTKLCFRLLEEVKKRNILISFDFNYRGKLWTINEAAAVYKKIIPFVDILFCSEMDLTAFLDTNKDKFFEKYQTNTLVIRERQILEHEKHSVKVQLKRITSDGVKDVLNSMPITFDVMEKIGSGDAFDAGVLHCLNKDMDDAEYALKFGLACFVLKHGVIGDVLTLNEATIKTCMDKMFLNTNNNRVER